VIPRFVTNEQAVRWVDDSRCEVNHAQSLGGRWKWWVYASTGATSGVSLLAAVNRSRALAWKHYSKSLGKAFAEPNPRAAKRRGK